MALFDAERMPTYPEHLMPQYLGPDPIQDCDAPSMDYSAYRLNASYGMWVLLAAEGSGRLDNALHAQHDLGVLAEQYPEHHGRYLVESYSTQAH